MRYLLTVLLVSLSACTASTPQWTACEEGDPSSCPDGYECARPTLEAGWFCTISCVDETAADGIREGAREACEALNEQGTAHASCFNSRGRCEVRCGSGLTCPDGTSCNGGYCTP